MSFCPFCLAIVLSVLRFTDSDYSFAIFKLFLSLHDLKDVTAVFINSLFNAVVGDSCKALTLSQNFLIYLWQLRALLTFQLVLFLLFMKPSFLACLWLKLKDCSIGHYQQNVCITLSVSLTFSCRTLLKIDVIYVSCA